MTKHTDLDATAVHVKALGKILDAHTAEYVVRACKAFPAMEKMCQDIIDSYGPEGMTGDKREAFPGCAKEYDAARAAIAKATG